MNVVYCQLQMADRKHHIFYRTINVLTDEYYYGIHSADVLNDSYLGSGVRLHNSIKKHGTENFVRETIATFETREELVLHEVKTVTLEMISDPKCMNIVVGGDDPPHVITDELRIKLRDSHKGKRLSAASIEKLKVSRKGKGTGKREHRSFSVKVINPDSSIETYESVILAAKTLSINPRQVKTLLDTGKTYFGYMFETPNELEKLTLERACNKRRAAKVKKPVLQLTLEDELIQEHPSMYEAAHAMGTSCPKLILECCRGQRDSAYNCHWHLKEPAE